MRASKDLAGVYKSERRGVLVIFDEAYAMEPSLAPASPKRELTDKPADPEEVDMYRFSHRGRNAGDSVAYFDVVNAHNPCVPERMGLCSIILIREQHDVAMCARIQGILSTSNIVGCIVDSDDFVLVHSITDERDLAAFFVREFRVAAVELLAVEPLKDIVFESRNKILLKG